MGPWLLAAVLCAAFSGLAVPLVGRNHRGADRAATLLLWVALACGAVPALYVLFTGSVVVLTAPWQIPYGLLSVRLDAIGAVFLLQILVLAALGSAYSVAYWPSATHPDNTLRLRLFYGLTTAGMVVVVVAHNTVLFLAGWEVMALSAFMALTADDLQREVREAGYLYMVATRLGTLALFAMFALMFVSTGHLEFSLGKAAIPDSVASSIFALALLGFGLKAGLMPLHLWLPSAHAAAPTHMSALMSGVLIKMGIYGLVRVSAMLPNPTLTQATILLVLGVVSGILGVAFALGQHDLKRLLAYHSVENIGIIVMGLGVAHLGRVLSEPALMALGIAGAVLHTFNHGVFKALLFLAAGSVVHATHTREMDKLGGLIKRMPSTAVLFLVGAVAICGLPPLNGFVSELLVYLGLFGVVEVNSRMVWLLGAFAAASLALIGGLALACFVKAFGSVFLGEPRSEAPTTATDPVWSMRAPMVALALLCLLFGLGAPLLLPPLERVAYSYAGVTTPLLSWRVPAVPYALVGTVLLIGCVLLFWLFVRRAAQSKAPADLGTWSCGYLRPDARMQYTSSSFAQMLVGLSRFALRPTLRRPQPGALFARPSTFHSHIPEVVLDNVVLPALRRALLVFRAASPLHGGSVNAYVFYIFATLLVVFLWMR